jgi:hypothetical protein
MFFPQRYTGIVNDREFRQRIADLLERQRQDAETQLKKPPAAEKPKKAKKTRSA